MRIQAITLQRLAIGLGTIALNIAICGIALAGTSKTTPWDNDYCNLCHVGGTTTDGTTSQTCVECHSSSASSTTYDLSGGGETVRVPVVNYTGLSAPTEYLAGGNFYWVVTLGNSYGHNVRNISDKDSELDVAPGGEGHTCADWSCHGSLTYPNTVHGHLKINGCRGCHYTVMHHGDDPQGQGSG